MVIVLNDPQYKIESFFLLQINSTMSAMSLTRTITSASAVTVHVFRHSLRADEDENSEVRATALARPFDTPLSPAGIAKAQTKAQGTAQVKPIAKTRYIFCSPFWRCIQTAREFQKINGGIIIIDHGLGEVWHPKVVKRPLAEITLVDDDKVSELTELFIRNDTPLPDEEETRGTGGSADARYRASFTRIAQWCAQRKNYEVIIVSHGDSVSSMAAMCGKEIYSIEPCGHITASYNGSWNLVETDEVGIMN